MKCTKCGAELLEGVLFCRECGAKVETQKKYCRECGKEVPVDARFCSYCGADLTIGQTSETTESDGEDEYVPSDDRTNEEIPTDTSVDTSKTFSDKETEIITVGDKIKVKLETFWNGLDFFTKVFTIVSAITCLLLLIAIISHSALAIFLSIVQVAGLVVAILWHRGILNSPKKWLKYVVLAAVILLTALNIMSYSRRKADVSQKSISPTAAASESTGTNFLVLVPCGSEDCIGQNYDTIKNEFISSGFTEISTKAVEDLLYSESEKVGTIESVSVGDVSDFTKDQQFNVSDRVEICYHAYKKAVVTIDVDFLSNLFFDKYGVVLYLNDEMVGKLAHGEDETFSQEVEPGTYTLAVRKEDDASCNGSLGMDIKGDVNISVQIKCQSDDILVDTLYIEKIGEVQAGEIMMPQAASSFKHLNYLDVQNTLEGLGFTNISTEILYDIYLGWTDNGEVENVIIAGNNSFNRGDIFTVESDVVIVYHMPYGDDPSRIKVEKDAYKYVGLNYMDVEQMFRKMGFSNIEYDEVVTEETTHSDGEVAYVQIAGNSFNENDSFAPDAKVVIRYYCVEEPAKIETITIENSDDFASLMKITNQTDATTIKRFVYAHDGEYIEFDGCVAFMMNHKNLKTRFDICLVGGDYTGRVYGPLFAFEDVNYYDMNVSGSDTVAQGMKFRITAQIDGFNDEGNYVILKPISLISR